MTNRESIGVMAAKFRKAMGLTQKQAAEQSSINASTISEIETGAFTGSFRILDLYLDFIGIELIPTPKALDLPDWDDIDNPFSEDDRHTNG